MHRLLAFSAVLCVGALLTSSVHGAEPRTLSPLQARQYQNVCARCHARADSGAPLVGDAIAWSERNAGGFEQLLQRTVDGWRTMPPLGTCGGCSEADLRALVVYVSGASDPAALPKSRSAP